MVRGYPPVLKCPECDGVMKRRRNRYECPNLECPVIEVRLSGRGRNVKNRVFRVGVTAFTGFGRFGRARGEVNSTGR